MKKLTTILFLAQFLILHSLPAQDLKSDSLALVAFYHATNGDQWNRRIKGWLDGPIRTWSGVEVTWNRVTGLTLVKGNLSGTIPPELGDLTSLRYLNLSSNSIGGEFPAFILNTPLTGINLEKNKFFGTLPVEFGEKLGGQFGFDLSHNDFSGPFPEVPKGGTGSVDISFNRFTSVPDNLFNSKRYHINVSNNPGMNGGIPDDYVIFINDDDSSIGGYFVEIGSLNFSNTEVCQPLIPNWDTWLSGIFSRKAPVVLSSGITCYRSCKQLNATVIKNELRYESGKENRLVGTVIIDSGATLIAEPGAIIEASQGSGIIIAPGGKIKAVGTASDPIVFTSDQAPGERTRLHWQGITILGRADGQSAMFLNTYDCIGKNLYYGSSFDLSDSTDGRIDSLKFVYNNIDWGQLKFVRIEFAGLGIPSRWVKEPRSSSLNMISAGRTNETWGLDRVMVSYSGGKGINSSGGRCNYAKLVLFSNYKTDLEFKNGYKGVIQWSHLVRGNVLNIPLFGIEAGLLTKENTEFFTHPCMSNVNVLGPLSISKIGQAKAQDYVVDQVDRDYREGVLTSAGGSYSNFLISGWPKGSFRCHNCSNLTVFRNSFVTGPTLKGYDLITRENARVVNVENLESIHNVNMVDPLKARNEDEGYDDPPNWNLFGGSPLRDGNGPIDTHYNDFCLRNNREFPAIGAFDKRGVPGSEWDKTWTNYDPVNTDYEALITSFNQENIASESNLDIFPNPVLQGKSTTISYQLHRSTEVVIEVLDGLSGKQLFHLESGYVVPKGNFQFDLQTKGLPSGLYLVKVITDGHSVTQRVMVQ